MVVPDIWLPRRIAGVALAAVLFVGVLTPASEGNEPWRFSITPYVWVPTVDAKIGERDLGDPVHVDVDTSDVIEKLSLPVLISGELQKGRIGLLYDFQYVRFDDSGSTGVTSQREYDADFTVIDATLGLEYRLINQPKQFSLDTFAGGRAVYAETNIELGAIGPVPASRSNRDTEWIDPIVGLKSQWSPSERWSFGAYGDIGGFGVGSDLTFQLMGVIGFNFNEHIALIVGYRYFSVDYDNDGFQLDAQIHGPIVGLTLSF